MVVVVVRASLLTRLEPAILRSMGSADACFCVEVSLDVVDIGVSESRSRLLVAGGLACGRGRSPTEASS